MSRLMMESLEGRELMSAGGSVIDEAALAPAPVEVRAAVAQSRAALDYLLDLYGFTPPIGSDKGSFASDGLAWPWPVRDGAGADARASGLSLNYSKIELEYTPPIGSDKGSFAGDGLGSSHSRMTDGTSNTILFQRGWATFPSSFSGDAYVNEMGFVSTTTQHAAGIIAILIGFHQSLATRAGGEVISADAVRTQRPEADGIIAILIGLIQSRQSGGGDMSSLAVAGTQTPQTNGIIAILIGLHQSPQPGGADGSSLSAGTQSTKGSFMLLPYIEQENIYKIQQVMEEEGIFYF